MGSQLQIHILISSILIATAVASTSITTTASPFFIFGDSDLDAGNNNYINTTLGKANFWPYGFSYFSFPTGRFSNGRVMSDFIAEYANLPLIGPFLQPGKPQFDVGVNFASAGASAFVQSSQFGSVINLPMQLKNYKVVEKWYRVKFGDAEARKRLTNAVYLISIGSNDYTSLVLNSTLAKTYSKAEFVDMVITSITDVVTEIYKTGGRKFAILNVPPSGCLPAIRMLNAKGNYECWQDISSYIILHNQVLFKVINKLKMELPGFQYSLFDYHSSLELRINQPSTYGFKDGKTTCCGSGKFRGAYSCGGKRPPVKEFELCEKPDDYLFWDFAHLTEKAHQQVAYEMWSSTNKSLFYGSYNFKDLFNVPNLVDR